MFLTSAVFQRLDHQARGRYMARRQASWARFPLLYCSRRQRPAPHAGAAKNQRRGGIQIILKKPGLTFSFGLVDEILTKSFRGAGAWDAMIVP